LKRFVKIGGEMVSLVKTESVLEELLPEGVDCCVVEVPDSLKGARIVVVITREVDEREILKKMGQKLTPIALPKQFIVVAELPKLGSGKIDFRSATELAKTKVTAK
jgi:acyl-[acyl-carrier-protein]-phospholipid O-acyltransferase/long-chain-fatty-acid--[acyl-carrier-protein] ligase